MYYRCPARTLAPQSSALATHPPAVYLREDTIQNAVNAWLGDLFHRDKVDRTVAALGLRDVDEHAARIRIGMRDDPPLAIGAATELLGTVFKAILGLEGTGKETRLDLPDLAKKVSVTLGLDDQGTRGDEPGAKQRRGVLKGLNSIVSASERSGMKDSAPDMVGHRERSRRRSDHQDRRPFDRGRVELGSETAQEARGVRRTSALPMTPTFFRQ